MKKNGLVLLLFTLVLVIVSCKKDNSDLPIEYKFVLLDTLGNEKTVFNEGENIIFSFQIINEGSVDLFLENFFPNNDFFRVFEPNTNEGTLDYGIPYEAYVKTGFFNIHANENFKFEYPWKGGIFWNDKYPILSNENINEDLPIGNFTTSFSQSFKFGNNIKTETKHFEINFTIK